MKKQKFKAFKVKDNSPPSYVGPKFYRFFHNVRSRGGRPFMVEYDPSDAERAQVLFDHRVRYHSILSSGLIVDEGRNLLPGWRVPLKAELAKGAEVSYEFAPAGFASERVRDVIEEFDPGLHVFFPIDLTLPDGTIQRWYQMLWSDDFFGQSVPILDYEANGTKVEMMNGKPYYHNPAWASSMALEPYTFGYIDPTYTRGLNLLGTDNLDNAEVISGPLAVRLEEMNVTLPKNATLVAMGVAR